MSAARAVTELRRACAVPLFVQPEWQEHLPWLMQGTTARGGDAEPFDLRLFGDIPSGTLLRRWAALRREVGFPHAVHARQVHGAEVMAHGSGPPGLLITEGCDGHATRAPGVLLTISVADCVPIFVVDPARRAVALLHGGWRGIAAGILEAGIDALARLGGSEPASLLVHFGPAICGACYEVGPEVFRALGLAEPSSPRPVDLRAALALRARARGVSDERLTTSTYCTRCNSSPFFSHRGGNRERQMGILGIRDGGG